MRGFAWGCWYAILRDLGSFIAGILALAAGIFAYYAGRLQATATREQKNQAHADAEAQRRLLEQQIAQRDREISEASRRAQFDLLKTLGAESARLDRLARDRHLLAQGRAGAFPRVTQPQIAAYQIERAPVLMSVGPLDFRGSGIMQAASTLSAMVEVLNSALNSAGHLGELETNALVGHLDNVAQHAQALRKRLEDWEIAHPLPPPDADLVRFTQ
jgi:hypothetical protein